MTNAARHILDTFEHLPESDKREVLATLLRITAQADYPVISDQDLTSAADELSLDYERREESP